MDGLFACPECGYELELSGTSPGRQIRCGWCETWVEVPFIPRAAVTSRWRSSRRRRPAWLPWAWGGLGLLAFLVVVAGSVRSLKSFALRKAEASVARQIEEAELLKEAGQLEKARDSYEAAIRGARRIWPPNSPRLAALRRDRDDVSTLAANAQLVAAEAMPPPQAIAVYRALLVRARNDASLAGLEETTRERLSRDERRSAESDLAAAGRALDTERAGEAVDLCERLVRTADDLDPASRRALAARAEEIVTKIIEGRGLVVDSSLGHFTLGTSRDYDTALRPLLDSAFDRGRYVQRRPSSHWNTLWNSKAPYRMAIEITERYEGTYLQSSNRLSVLSAQMTLSRNNDEIWKAGPLLAQSPQSLPKLSAYQAGRVGMNDQRSPTFERLLYDEARAALIEKLKTRLQRFPECGGHVAPASSR